MPITEIRVAGFGGQGVILAAMIIGKAASIFQDGYATLTQSFGPEARGSACSAQVVLSDKPVLYPYITQPDILIAMSQDAHTRFTPELKSNGVLLAEEDLVRISKLGEGIRAQYERVTCSGFAPGTQAPTIGRRSIRRAGPAPGARCAGRRRRRDRRG